MGNDLSSLNKDQVADAVRELGPKYEAYAEVMRDNAIDGELLSSLNDEELSETFDELEISSKLHKRVLKQTLNKAREGSTSNPNDAQEEQQPTTSNDNSSGDSSIFQAGAQYKLTCSSPTSDLAKFDPITDRLIQSDSDCMYASVSLILEDGQNRLSAMLRPLNSDKEETLLLDRVIMPHDKSQCSAFFQQTDKDFIVTVVPPPPPNDARFGGLNHGTQDVTYIGQVIKNQDGDRVGVICHAFPKQKRLDLAQQETLLKELAEVAAEQLRTREALLKRTSSLSNRIEDTTLKMKKKDESEEPNIMETASTTEEKGKDKNDRFAHLAPDFFDLPDKIGMKRPPIAENDMERVASIEALGLLDMDPTSEHGVSLERLVSMAADIIGYPMAWLSVLDQEKDYMYFIQDRIGFLDIEPYKTMFQARMNSEKSLCCYLKGRNITVCNYTIYLKETFEVSDLYKDERFSAFEDLKVIRAYAGTPIFGSNGHVLATLCLMDVEARFDFTQEKQTQLENIARIMEQTIENWALRKQVEESERERAMLLKRAGSSKIGAPTGDVTLVFTDIQGSTSLWESNSVAMRKALDVHDRIMRQCIGDHGGYEIKTEGDAFHIAFHDPVDAIAFALEAQLKLHHAPWDDDILSLPEACIDENYSFRGLRVRMGLHHGPTTSEVHDVTRRTVYSGESFKIGKSVEAMCHGGQILTTADTWRVAAALLEQLGFPQVLDVGEHVLTTGDNLWDGVIAKHVVQIVPKELAYDYAGVRGGESQPEDALGDLKVASKANNNDGSGGGTNNITNGRQFPSPITKRRMSTSFSDAPYQDGQATIMFIYPGSGVDGMSDEVAHSTFAILGKVTRSLLMEVNPPGYECQEDHGKWLVAFATVESAVQLGLKLLSALCNSPFDDGIDREKVVRIGVHSGTFTKMGPHPMTGRADYYGTVVNRAARVAAAADTGKVYVGVPMLLDNVSPTPPQVGSMTSTKLLEVRKLKGVSVDMALYECFEAS